MTPPCAGAHPERRFVRKIQAKSTNTVALRFRADAPSAPTKSIAYVTPTRIKCRRWVKVLRFNRECQASHTGSRPDSCGCRPARRSRTGTNPYGIEDSLSAAAVGVIDELVEPHAGVW